MKMQIGELFVRLDGMYFEGLPRPRVTVRFEPANEEEFWRVVEAIGGPGVVEASPGGMAMVWARDDDGARDFDRGAVAISLPRKEAPPEEHPLLTELRARREAAGVES